MLESGHKDGGKVNVEPLVTVILFIKQNRMLSDGHLDPSHLRLSLAMSYGQCGLRSRRDTLHYIDNVSRREEASIILLRILLAECKLWYTVAVDIVQ